MKFTRTQDSGAEGVASDVQGERDAAKMRLDALTTDLDLARRSLHQCMLESPTGPCSRSLCRSIISGCF